MSLVLFIYRIYCKIVHLSHIFFIYIQKKKLGYCGKRVKVVWPNSLSSKIYLYDDVYIYGYTKFIIGRGGKFIMKHHSGVSQGLTVITGKHGDRIGKWFHDTMWTGEFDVETTVTVEEDARIGANATLMPGVTVGRGAQVGACSVVTKDVPPYAVVAGNPAKVIKFIFSPEQIIQHEKILYPEQERLSVEYLCDIQNQYLNKSEQK